MLERGNEGGSSELGRLGAAVVPRLKRLMRERAFRTLTSVERGIVYLASRSGLRLVSPVLLRTLYSILDRASRSTRSPQGRMMAIGRRIALANVKAAFMMGLAGAEAWLRDDCYVRLLGLNAAEWRT
jgi:hypothetical protein